MSFNEAAKNPGLRSGACWYQTHDQPVRLAGDAAALNRQRVSLLKRAAFLFCYGLPPLPVYLISATGPQHLSGPCADRYAFAGRAALSGGP